LHFFGRFGLWFFGLSVACFLAMLYFKYIFPWPYLWWGRDEKEKSFIATPLPVLAAMFILAGITSILQGIQSEVNMRTYYESQQKTTYLLGEVRQGKPDDVDGPR
jgi:dolichol-phosphate mannosyltransferase